jgi:hypothetical protein
MQPPFDGPSAAKKDPQKDRNTKTEPDPEQLWGAAARHSPE